ncbi:hypothetical protein JKF63_00986 [Porcisia hertigi]|uniref:Uncharacterized protein n=1 Tax=Porcisia hertigi TaxID=2761500 RepID=A0A836KXP1_9TRYP|nr:hypothetical protein JKF63_00986 [Porcisia hertigi]
MHPVKSCRLVRCLLRIGRTLLEYANTDDANGPSSRAVDSDVWYASMFLYPNHWQAGHGGALPLPGSPYQSFPMRSLLWRSRDYILSLLVLLLIYVAVAFCVPASLLGELTDSF